MIPDMTLGRLLSWFFNSLDKRQSMSCILEEGSSQQQSNIVVKLSKYKER